MKQKADQTIDLRGFIIPVALLKVSQVFRELAPDQTLEILCCDSDIMNDLLKILPVPSYELILAENSGDGNAFRIQMKKKHSLGI